ncbi:PREDICTED: immunoglobulin iota chain-like [Rhinopithecus bieti]|uniref:immunoglobulin iota chain-like n=1 Tax=Rhinopithecus bieti TaxID=61621 RepID=UPI00083C4DE9|nr:PREDICTED: immunoglobulin iota chain-like [Rhinopithecus bieti]
MAWAPVLLLIFYYFSGSLSQALLIQLPSLSAHLRNVVRLPCTPSRGCIVGGCHIFLYQQKSRSLPQYLLKYYSDSSKQQEAGVPSHFCERFLGQHAGILHISELQPESKSDYYYFTYHSNSGTLTVVPVRKVLPHEYEYFGA